MAVLVLLLNSAVLPACLALAAGPVRLRPAPVVPRMLACGTANRLSARRASPPRALTEAETAAAVVAEPAAALTRAHVAHILVDTEELALLVAEKLDQGSDFARTAETVSTCDSTARGGDLGWITPGMYVPEFDAVVFNSAPGETVVADTPFGWHVIRVLDASSLPLEMSPAELKRRLAPGGSPPQLVDIRDLDELERAPLLDPRFLSLPYTQWQEWTPRLIAAEIPGIDLDQETLFMDHRGGRGERIAQFLAQSGLPLARYLDGGINAYAEQANAAVPLYLESAGDCSTCHEH